MDRLGLEVVDLEGLRTTTSLKIPKELPTVEETLKMLAGALQAPLCWRLTKSRFIGIQTVALLQKKLALGNIETSLIQRKDAFSIIDIED